MTPDTTLQIDARRVADIVSALANRRPGYLPDWQPPEQGAGAALVQIHARYLEAVIDRLNQVPDKNRLAFLDMLGVQIIPARAARAPVVFQLSKTAPATRLAAGARIAAPPPPESTEQIVFEIERGLGLTPARIQQVVSLWPGRDQYIDHSAAFAAGQPIRPLARSQLKDTPHEIYIAHDTLLNLAGKVTLDVEFELSQPGSEPLDSVWEYWDGKVWRGFKAQHPECLEVVEQKLDGTAGFTRNGRVRLETDCAESATREVNGAEAFWIRGRLDEPLPLDPDQILPEVTQIRLMNVTERPLVVTLANRRDDYKVNSKSQLTWLITDTNGGPLSGVAIQCVGQVQETDPEGKATFEIDDGPKEIQCELAVFDQQFVLKIGYKPIPRNKERTIAVVFELDGLQPDSAFATAEQIDLSAPFYPLGPQPQPGAAFYFTSEEAFTKPGAKLILRLAKTTTPQDEFEFVPADDVTAATARREEIDHQINWEYWNGRRWSLLAIDAEEPVRSFDQSGTMEFSVPNDIAPTKVNDQESLWIRARLVSGGYGFKQESKLNESVFTSVIPQPPALSDFRISYTWEYGPFHAERVLAFNDFEYTDDTEIARWPGTSFKPFSQVADLLPALYIGHDQALPVDRANLFFDLTEGLGDTATRALAWEYWNGFRWRKLSVEDETDNFQYPGMVSLIGPPDSARRPRFGEDLYWLRARLKEDGPPPTPEVLGIFLNAAWATQQQTIVNETLGTSQGLANETYSFQQAPVLNDPRPEFRERVEVRELTGQRAGVEWRILAMALFGGDRQVLRELEQELAAEGDRQDIIRDDLHLRRDRNKRVIEAWVRWQPQPHFLESQPDDRHYVLDRAAGILRFGNGRNGKIPPPGAEVVARQYRSGGGRAGNVAVGAINQPLTGIPGVESISNPRPAGGGADAESLESFSLRGPRTLRHRRRALTLGDFETMAFEASPAVAVAQALPTRDSQGRTRPGWVTLILIPRSDEPRPWPSPGLRDEVRRYIEQRTGGDIAAARQIYVTGPEYLAVGVEAAVAPVAAEHAGEVERLAREAIARFLHPLDGGPQASGWPAGRDVYLSDLAAVLERVARLDHVRELTLTLDGVPQGESIPIPPGKVVVAGEIRIRLV